MAGFYNVIDEANFKKPDMGEYYDENLMEEFLSQIDYENPENAAYYVEEPFSTRLGYHEDYEAFVIKATPFIKAYYSEAGEYYEDINAIDGDTVVFDMDSINDGGYPFTINGSKYSSFQHYCRDKLGSDFFDADRFGNNVLKIRSVGVDAPEIPHYSIITIKTSDINSMVKYYTEDEIKKFSYNLVYEINKERKPNTKYPFVYLDENKKGSLYEVIDLEYPNGKFESIPEGKKLKNVLKEMVKNGDMPSMPEYVTMKILVTDKQKKSDMKNGKNMGLLAKDIVIEMLSEASDIRIVVDAKQLVYESGYAGIYQVLEDGLNEDQTAWDLIKAFYTKCFGKNLFKYPGFTTFGQDAYKRFLGATYVKTKVGSSSEYVWVNVNKYLISQLGQDYMELKLGQTPIAQYTGNGVSDAFKVWSYDNSRSVIADGFYKISEADFDDRRAIQKQITGLDFSLYRDYTVMIGDCLFMVPPTSIRVVNQIDSERVNLLRSKGSMTKTRPHTDRVIEMTLYFNEDEGINGVPIQKQLPSQRGTDKTMTYYMNGLRTLIAMFRYTPFLPIENSYINETLGIEAVSLANLQIQTIPMYPKCIAATLTLQQFNYRVYLNELPVPSPEDGEHWDKNMFASTINYEVMRYYYQKAIANGENIKHLDPTSDEFIEATMGSKTSLIPVNFLDQTIRFSLLDREWLDKLLKIKNLAEKRPLQQTQEINKTTTEWAYKVGHSLSQILVELRKQEFKPLELSVNATEEGLGEIRENLSLSEEFSRKFIQSGLCPYLLNVRFGTKVDLTFDTASTTREERVNLMTAIYKELDLDSNEVTILVDGKLSFDTEVIADSKHRLKASGDVWKVAEFFVFRSTGMLEESVEIDHENWGNFSQVSNEQFYQDMKDNALDYETIKSAKFKEYPLEDIVAQQFSISMGNVLANIKLKAQDGYAPQFAGGQDTIIDFVFHTTNEKTVGLLNAMQQMAAEDLITYRKVINCWPIRINSEMTRLCGIHEVAIESIDISTVPMQPGLFAVQVRAISVDRTMRNKEALRRIDNMNNAGSTNQEGVSGQVYKTYFDLKTTLSKAEIYPDLELPTIEELESAGFKYIRYMKQKALRTYPDPDFYFVYGYVYSSQMLRKTITDYFDARNGENGEALGIAIEDSKYEFSDKITGQYSTMSLDKENKDNVIKFEHRSSELNEAYVNSLQDSKAATNAVKQAVQEEEIEKSKVQKAAKPTPTTDYNIMSFNVPSWNVCKKIKCTFSDDVIQNDVNNIAKNTENYIISLIDRILSKPITKKRKWKYLSGTDFKSSHGHLTLALEDYIDDITNENSTMFVWSQIYTHLSGVGLPNKELKKTVAGIIEACAMAMSGASEYYEKAPQDQYKSRSHLFMEYGDNKEVTNEPCPYSLIQDKDTGEVFYATSKEQAFKEGFTFGMFQIRKYEPNVLYRLYPQTEYRFEQKDFLDPYYNKTINKDANQEEYIDYIINCPRYAIEAFSRISFMWIKDMIRRGVFLNLFDVKRKEIARTLGLVTPQGTNLGTDHTDFTVYQNGTTYSIPNATKEEREQLNAIIENNKDLIKAFESYDINLFCGKVFMAMCAAVTHGEGVIYSEMLDKDTGALNARTRNCQTAMDVEADMTDAERTYRKLIRGLIASKFDVVELDGLGSSGASSIETATRERAGKLWLEASKDPSLWVLHSFYDMIVHDKRGRMTRAFPAYYMLLIDEGREIGYWKLHDNFYNIASISEIEVTRSRKIPADTARIVMTNMFKTFSTEDEEIKTDYEHNVRDVFNSVFSPRIYFQEAEQKRTEQMDINRATLKPGARVHLRMGYSGDASELPIIFNGVVAEVNPGEIMEIIAQGDGHEIANQGVFDGLSAKDVADIGNESDITRGVGNFFNAGNSPKQLIKNVFTTKGGIPARFINWVTNGRFFNDNAFGISHFGEIDYKDIHPDGEIMQNIYEGEGGMPWHNVEKEEGTKSYEYCSSNPPVFTIQTQGKSVWDIMNICASASSEFITGITTFGLRSTLFHGRPHYYYAYDYDLTDEGLILEKRKPYQQYHIIDSFSDIIGNNIKASGSDIKTVAIGTYLGDKTIGGSKVRKTKPLYIDWDIYPEYQKTVTVDTQMRWEAEWYKKTYAGYIDKYDEDGGMKIAWRMAARYLKESVKDMYQGEVICIGDATIKPLDRCYIHDIYENMNGAFDVEAVVHRMTPETGFTTSVFADCISTVDSRFDEIGRAWSLKIATQVSIAKCAIYVAHRTFGTTTKPLITWIAKTANKSGYIGASAIKKAVDFVGMDEVVKYSKMEEWSESFYKLVGLSSSEVALWSKLDDFKKWKNLLNSFDVSDATTVSDVIEALSGVNKVLSGTGPEKIANAIEEALKKGNIKEDKIDDITKVANELKEVAKKIDTSELEKSIKELRSGAIKSLEALEELTDVQKNALKVLKNADLSDVKDASKILDALKDVSNIMSNDVIETVGKAVAKYSNDVAKIMKNADNVIDAAKLGKMLLVGSAGTVALPVTIATHAIEFALGYVLVKTIYDWIESTMASFNVLTIHPLRKNGTVFVAGIDGHKGLVVGSPTWEKGGIIDNFINWAFRDRKGWLDNVLRGALFSEEMNQIAKTYIRENKSEDTSYTTETTISGLLESMANSTASNHSQYRALALVKRIRDVRSPQGVATYNYNRVIEADGPRVYEELIPITADNAVLEKYFKSGLFTIAHNANNDLKKSAYSVKHTAYASNITYNGIIDESKKGVVDIPFLRPDSFQVLNRFLEIVSEREEAALYGDEQSINICLTSGTRAGDNTWSATGYIFRIQAPNFNDVEGVLEQMKSEFVDIYMSENANIGHGIISYEKKGNAWDIFVAPENKYLTLEE